MSANKRILVLSDTHGSLSFAKRAAELYAPDMLLHLGDHWRDAEKLASVYDIPVIYVRGNCDAGGVPETELVTICGRRIFMAHGHQYGVKFSLQRLCYAAQEQEAEAVLFGHTHVAQMDFCGSLLVLNPGSAGRSRDGRESCAVLDVSESGILPEIHTIPPK